MKKYKKALAMIILSSIFPAALGWFIDITTSNSFIEGFLSVLIVEICFIVIVSIILWAMEQFEI